MLVTVRIKTNKGIDEYKGCQHFQETSSEITFICGCDRITYKLNEYEDYSFEVE